MVSSSTAFLLTVGAAETGAAAAGGVAGVAVVVVAAAGMDLGLGSGTDAAGFSPTMPFTGCETWVVGANSGISSRTTAAGSEGDGKFTAAGAGAGAGAVTTAGSSCLLSSFATSGTCVAGGAGAGAAAATAAGTDLSTLSWQNIVIST